jgi:hypothetical protein
MVARASVPSPAVPKARRLVSPAADNYIHGITTAIMWAYGGY